MSNEYEIRVVKDDPERTHNLVLNGQIVGFAIVAEYPDKRQLYYFELHGPYRNKGHGPKFLECLEDAWKHEGVTIAEVFNVSISDKGFYEKCGYKTVAEKEGEHTLQEMLR